jgi:hypothetical protein
MLKRMKEDWKRDKKQQQDAANEMGNRERGKWAKVERLQWASRGMGMVWHWTRMKWVAGAMPVSLGQRVAREMSLRTFSADYKLRRRV